MKTREELLLANISRHMKGIEIAPYHRPIAPKSQGYNCLTLDIFDTNTLRERASRDPNIINNIDKIEEVDIVGSATELESAIEARSELGSYDYILSSHNFEHLPNPIKFLRACGAVLKPGGILSMAIPDKRKTFDIARRLTSTSDFIESYHLDRRSHSAYQIFDFMANFAKIEGSEVVLKNDLRFIYDDLIQRRLAINPDYVDIHASVFTMESFWQIITDCTLLKLIPLLIVNIKENGIEFIVQMQNIGYDKITNQVELDLLSTRSALASVSFSNC